MKIDILTIFPELFTAYIDTSILGRARADGVLDIQIHDIRDYATDRHRTVDDTPYGGGPGMVLKIAPIAEALQAITTSPPSLSSYEERGDRPASSGVVGEVKKRTIVLSARGEQFTQRKAEEYAQLDSLTLICGRYEGIDQRVADNLADEELSIGPYVMAGGEVAAMAVIEATTRLIPGVLGNEESLREESYNTSPQPSPSKGEGVLTEYPQYTKPEEYKGWKVPEVLLSGNHEEIKKWRQEQSRLKM